MVIGTRHVHSTQTCEISVQTSTCCCGWNKSSMASRYRWHVAFETVQRRPHFLTVIDVFSKKAWSIPLTNKSAFSLTAAFRRLLKNNDEPQTMQTDKGKLFLNRQLQDFYKQKGIRHFTTHNEETKACIVERFNRTLKTRMWKYFTKYQTLRYLDVVKHLVDSYHASYHRSIGMSPTEVKVVHQEKCGSDCMETKKTAQSNLV